MARQRIQNEGRGPSQNRLGVTKGKECSNAAAFPSLTRDLHRKLDDRLQILFLGARKLRANRFKHRDGLGMAVVVKARGGWRNQTRRDSALAKVVDFTEQIIKHVSVLSHSQPSDREGFPW